MKKLAPPYEYLGEDDWSRKLFKTNTGVTLVDVDGELYTIARYAEFGEGWGEPDHPTGIETPSTEPHYDAVWVDAPMPVDYTCCCGLSVHPSKRNPEAIHISDCPYKEV